MVEYLLLYDFLASGLPVNRFCTSYYKGHEHDYYSKTTMANELDHEIYMFMCRNKYLYILNYISFDPKNLSIQKVKKERKNLLRAVEDYNIILTAKEKLISEVVQNIEEVIRDVKEW